MKAFKTSFNKDNSFIAEPGYIIDNYITANDGLGYSLVRTHLNGRHPLMKNTSSHRTYYFIFGSAKFYVGKEVFELTSGEMMTIPKNTKYSFEGNFEALLLSVPAFNPAEDIIYK